MFAEALVCLALNVYHEARDQPFIGQVAVVTAASLAGTVMASQTRRLTRKRGIKPL